MKGWTKEALAEARRRVGPKAMKEHPFAPYRNRLEKRVADCMEARKRAGVNRGWWYERVRIRLDGGAKRAAWFTPDFFELTEEGPTIIEAKGFMREAAWVRLRVLAGMGFAVWVVRSNGKDSLTWERV